MKITAIKKGTTLMNKVNGAKYKVVELEGNTGLAANIDPETNEVYDKSHENYEEIVLSDENDICFKALNIPKDEEVPDGYTVKDGKLILDGEEVTEQGEICVEKILAALPGYLVLAVKPRDKESKLIDLFIYEPERDRFTKLIRYNSIPMPETVKELTGAILLGYNQTHIEEEPDEDGVATEVEYFDRSALMLVANHRLNSVFFERPMDFTDFRKFAGSEHSFLLSSKKDVEDGKVVDSKIWYEKVVVDAEHVAISTAALWNQPYETVVSAAVCHVADGGIVLKGNNYIQYGDSRMNTPLAAQVKGEHLVDITKDGDDEIWTFATDKYEISKIKKTRTKDRGNIYSIL